VLTLYIDFGKGWILFGNIHNRFIGPDTRKNKDVVPREGLIMVYKNGLRIFIPSLVL
jgi:hypothetical protein